MSQDESSTLTLADYTLHYWCIGPRERPTVLFTHGATADHRMFHEQVAALAPEYHVVTWDVRGHGRSRPVAKSFTLQDCAQDIVTLLDVLGVAQAVLVGQSMGGIISQYVYLQAPQRISALAMIGSVSVAIPYSRRDVLALKLTLPLFQVWPYGHFQQTIARQVSTQPAVQAYMLEAMSVLSRWEFLQIWKAVTLAVNTSGLPGHQIRVPLLLMHGENDQYGAVRRDARKWAAHEPNVDHVVVPNAGHNANQDNPVFTNQVLREFLRRVTSIE